MKYIHTLSIKPNLTKTAIRKDLIEVAGSYNKEHYKKYWLKNDLKTVYSEDNARSLALHELTSEEFAEESNNSNVQIKAVEPEDALKTTSHSAKYLDFEKDKYDYYSVTKYGKHFNCGYLVRVAK